MSWLVHACCLVVLLLRGESRGNLLSFHAFAAMAIFLLSMHFLHSRDLPSIRQSC